MLTSSKQGFGFEVYTTNSLLHVYASSGCIKSARILFDWFPRRDSVSWNTMIDGYIKFGNVDMAYELFEAMPVKNVVSWTAIISGFVKEGLHKEALTLFHEMLLAGVKPDSVSLASSLAACARLGALDQGRWIHIYIDKNGIQIDPILGCVLVDMYVKCGVMEEGLDVFRKLEKKCLCAWTAIIAGFAIHGRGREALDWFTQMQKAGIKPNQITFVAVLTACSHAGLIKEGKSLFEGMMTVHKLKPSIEHYGCMVDLLGRAGLLKEAKEFTEKMPLKPNAVIWGALLNACRIHGHLEYGKQIGKLLIELDPKHGGRYIHLASMHAAAGEWDQAVQVRSQMTHRGVLKLPGCSTISLNGAVHELFAGAVSHPQIKEIYDMWDRIAERLTEEGYEPVTGDLLLDLEDGEKEIAIQHHSEKLAIALGLLTTKPGTAIRIFKNLRVCKDCHTATKLISKIYSRDILVRDRTRFHFISEGKCSCGDYW
ncbi:Pentatricopeptide repeat [Quillaja saponaria]|uniref:Pentatricopeptide repeat n=1 Tax=Quillaja saponaria TaxID=32244 RepID=A0AAD7L975_QUISA|nr:Pentatricopeptide repeat [Quillaja saponaria]